MKYNSLADVPIETYSNNLGFYNQVFTVLPAAASANKYTSGRPERQGGFQLEAASDYR